MLRQITTVKQESQMRHQQQNNGKALKAAAAVTEGHQARALNRDKHGRPVRIGCIIRDEDHMIGRVVAIDRGALLMEHWEEDIVATQPVTSAYANDVEVVIGPREDDIDHLEAEFPNTDADGRPVTVGCMVLDKHNGTVGRVVAICMGRLLYRQWQDEYPPVMFANSGEVRVLDDELQLSPRLGPI